MSCAVKSSKYQVVRYQKPLTPARQAKLLAQYHRLLWQLARWAMRLPFAVKNVDAEDLYQEAAILLLDAWTRFDPTREIKFITYATDRIKHKLRTFVVVGGLIRTPTSACPGKYRRDNLIECGEKVRSVTSFAVLFDLDRNFVGEPTASAQPESAYEVEIEAMLEAIRYLPARQRRIVECRCGLTNRGQMTLEETGRIFGIGKERVRQIQMVALDKVRTIAAKLIRRRLPDSPCIAPRPSPQ